MDMIKVFAAAIALFFAAAILGSSLAAAWMQSPATEDLLTLTDAILSWPVAAGGLAFGGGQAMLQAWRGAKDT
ncbi:MAG: hypothetical protein AAFZ58_02430 [Pseudomonadota bacterium]